MTTDPKEPGEGLGLDLDDDFDWDEVLSELEQEAKPSADAASPAAPQPEHAPVPAPPQALYQPPAPGEAVGPPKPLSTPPPAAAHSLFEDEDDIATMIGDVPSKLLDSLRAPDTPAAQDDSLDLDKLLRKATGHAQEEEQAAPDPFGGLIPQDPRSPPSDAEELGDLDLLEVQSRPPPAAPVRPPAPALPPPLPPPAVPPPVRPLAPPRPAPMPPRAATPKPTSALADDAGRASSPDTTVLEPEAETRALDDQGAKAARRTVKYRKPRDEHFPLIGSAPEVLEARAAMLEGLAKTTDSAARAGLLTAAAELREQRGDIDAAHALYVAARAADPHDIVALRALRRAAMTRGQYKEAAGLLSAEAALPLSAADRAAALSLLAELQIVKLDDTEAGERSARAALKANPDSAGAALLLAQVCAERKRTKEQASALSASVEAWADPSAKGVLLSMAGHALERHGEFEQAAESYAQATAVAPDDLPAWLGLLRCCRRASDTDALVAAAEGAARSLGDDGVREALLYVAARYVQLGANKPELAVTLLEGGRSVPTLRARARAAQAAADPAAYQSALIAWTEASGGTDRAMALTQLAELHVESGQSQAAVGCLRDAARADERLGLVRVVREVLGRKSGDPSLRAGSGNGADATEDALAAAARLARGTDLSAEREMLSRAQAQGLSPTACEVLSLDAAAQAGDVEGIANGLRQQVERSTDKLGGLLALAEQAAARGDATGVESFLGEARHAASGRPEVLRPLARLVQARSAPEAATLWLEESASAAGAQAAFAATWAGRLLGDHPDQASAAFRRALSAEPGYPPAAWALEPMSRRTGDVATLSDVNQRQAKAALDPVERAGRLIRLAFLQGEDRQAALDLLESARGHTPGDAILLELTMRLAGDMQAADRAALLEGAAKDAPADFRRSALVRAAAAYTDAGDHDRAVEIYSEVAADNADDFLAHRALDQAELAAGRATAVAARKQALCDAAQDDESKLRALQELAHIHAFDRDNPKASVESIKAILAMSPGHLPSLRALERHCMDDGNDEDLLEVEKAMVEHLADGRDVAAHARLAARLVLQGDDAPGSAADEVLLAATDRAEIDLWLARRVSGAARAAGDAKRHAIAAIALARLLSNPLEQAAAALRAAEAYAAAGSPAQAVAVLEPAVQATPDHPTLAQQLARMYDKSGNPSGAAGAYEIAARAARGPRRIADMWYRAGVLCQDELQAPDRAIAALSAAAKADATYLDVFSRLKALLAEKGDTHALAELVEARIATGADAAVLAQLHSELAGLREELGGKEATKEALRSALALDGERLDLWHKLANTCLDDHDWTGAAEALIRIARLERDAGQLAQTFLKLGEIYDTHMPDLRRAEAAYKRVIKLIPDDLSTLRKLADLYRKEAMHVEAAQVLSQLATKEPDPELNRDFRIQLAAEFEAQGDARKAESVLEQTRRMTPADAVVVKAQADLYRRLDARSALAMHLDRATSDFRRLLDEDLANEQAWNGLVQVHGWKGQVDAARACASTATAVGLEGAEFDRLLDAHGAIPAARGAAIGDAVIEQLLPAGLSASAVRAFQMANDALDGILPFDLAGARAELAPSGHAFTPAAREACHWFGIPSVALYRDAASPLACIPISATPPALLVGDRLFDLANEHERLFLVVRALGIMRAGFTMVARNQPAEAGSIAAGLIRVFDAGYEAPNVDTARASAVAQELTKTLRKKEADLAPLVLEIAGAQDFDPTRMGLLATQLGDRIALLATGSVPAAVGALLKIDGESGTPTGDPMARAQSIRRSAAARALVDFALSDAHLEARRSAGVGTR